MFKGEKRKREEEKAEQALRDRTAKRAARGARNPAVSAEFDQATETTLDALETLRERSKGINCAQFARARDGAATTTLWGNGLRFAQGHFTTEQEAHQIIEAITEKLAPVLDCSLVEEIVIQQWEAIISERANRTASVVAIAQSMVGALRDAIVTNTLTQHDAHTSLRRAGSSVMARVPYEGYQELVPRAERTMEHSALSKTVSPAPASAIERLKRRTRAIAADAEIGPDDGCAVCQERFQPGEEVIELRCNHVFHEECVADWLRKGSPNCPVCRKPVSLASIRSATTDSRAGSAASSRPASSLQQLPERQRLP